MVCPAGIQLRELWVSVKEDLVQSEGAEPAMLSPFSFFRGLQRDAWERMGDYGEPLARARHAVTGNGNGEHAAEEAVPLSLNGPAKEAKDPLLDAGHFADCFSCKNCTSVCPVVGNYEDPGKVLGLLPHQIMGCLGLGLQDMASRSRMLWDCATCYLCEEHCPQGVRITDIFYTLKNRAARPADGDRI